MIWLHCKAVEPINQRNSDLLVSAAPSAGALYAFFFFKLIPKSVLYTLLNIFLLVFVIGPEADVTDAMLLELTLRANICSLAGTP